MLYAFLISPIPASYSYPVHLIPREERTLSVFENRVLRTIGLFGNKLEEVSKRKLEKTAQ
jgi:hypothetical protein